jgi:hypothetical protein
LSGTVDDERLPDPTTYTDAKATKLGLKTYLHGTSYNAGISPTVTSSQSGFSVQRAIFIPYQLQDGSWRIKANVSGIFTSATITTIQMTVNGVTFKNISGYSQPGSVAFAGFSGGCRAFASEGTGILRSDISGGTTTSEIKFFVDAELDSKPTWAY